VITQAHYLWVNELPSITNMIDKMKNIDSRFTFEIVHLFIIISSDVIYMCTMILGCLLVISRMVPLVGVQLLNNYHNTMHPILSKGLDKTSMFQTFVSTVLVNCMSNDGRIEREYGHWITKQSSFLAFLVHFPYWMKF
jgi:hypothetical protein